MTFYSKITVESKKENLGVLQRGKFFLGGRGRSWAMVLEYAIEFISVVKRIRKLNSTVPLRWERVEPGGSAYLEIDVEEMVKTFSQDEINKFNMWKQIFRLT